MKTQNKIILGIISLLLFCVIFIGVFVWGYYAGRTHGSILHATDKGFDYLFWLSGIRNEQTDELLGFYESRIYSCVNIMGDCRDYPLLNKYDRTSIDNTLTGIANYFEKYPPEERDVEYEANDFVRNFANDPNFAIFPDLPQKLAEFIVRVSDEVEKERRRAETVLERYRKQVDNE